MALAVIRLPNIALALEAEWLGSRTTEPADPLGRSWWDEIAQKRIEEIVDAVAGWRRARDPRNVIMTEKGIIVEVA